MDKIERKISIVVAEDESIVAEDIMRRLRNSGYEVPATASSAKEVIEAAEKYGPDLILMDIVLHGDDDGIEAAKEIHSRFDIPVVFLTAYADQTTVEKAKLTGPYGYVIKPFEDRLLQITIEMAIYKHGAEKRLRESEEELKEHRERLMEMVEERTFELKAAVKLLTQEIAFRKSTEETLKESETKFRSLSQEFNTLLDAIPDMLLLLDRDLKIMWSNKAAMTHFSLEETAITGKECHKLWHKSDAPCENCLVLKSFQTGDAELSQRPGPDGKLFDSRAFPIKDETGQVNNVILVVSDITEKMLLQAEAMRASHLASLGELAAGVAHEINNPINGIINYAQILSNRSIKESREHDIAGRIIKEGDRISGIVKSLLSFARERREEKLPSAIQKILIDAITLTEAQIRKDGILITIRLPEDLPEIIANPQQIQQVFLNIISNSRYALNKKYHGTHANKRIEISGEKIFLDDVPFLRVIFKDNGSGIPAEILDKIMNPFFSTKPSGQGTGLGLSISHGLVKDHGGKLVVESEEDNYTRVILDLPAKDRHGKQT